MTASYRFIAGALLVAVAVAAPVIAVAQTTPGVLHYQGRITDPGGLPLAGPVTLVFSLFDEAEAGTALWTETHPDVVLNEGVANVLLGSLTAIPENAFSGAARYLELSVDGSTLSPRLAIASVPYALEAERLDGQDASAFEPAGTAAAFADSLAADDLTPPNTGDNRVHWNNLVGVPEGFADGGDAVFDGEIGVVTAADIRDSTLTALDVQPRSLTGSTLELGTITGSEVALETLTGDHIQDDGIRSADILDGTITGADFAAGTIGETALQDGAVTGAKIADGTIQIDDVAFLVGDVTEVIAGNGLSGGGSTGAVTLSIVGGTGIAVSGSSISLAPSYVSGSAYDGRFVVASNPNWTPVAGATVVSAAAFRPVTPTGKYTVAPLDGTLSVDSVNNVGAEDEFTAPIQLPHGGTITAFWVTYWDNSGGSLETSLWRARQDGSSKSKIASVTSSGQNAAWQSVVDDIITETAIDNIEFVYWLVADFPGTPQGTSLRLLSARVQYTVSRPD